MNMPTIITRRVVPLSLVLFALCVPGASLAQLPEDVIVAVPEHFPEVNGGAVALVIYESDRTVVLLRGDRLDTHTLAAALKLAGRDRDEVTRDGLTAIAVVTGVVARRHTQGTPHSGLAPIIAALHRAPTSSLGDLGDGRWVRRSVGVDAR